MLPLPKSWRVPKGWSVHHGRDPEVEQRRLKRRFRAITRRLERAAMVERISGLIAVWTVILIGAAALFVVLGSLLTWPPSVALRHIAAWPSCTSARAAGGWMMSTTSMVWCDAW
jgi:hypothetical protein